MTASPPSKTTLIRVLRNGARGLAYTEGKLFGFRDKKTGTSMQTKGPSVNRQFLLDMLAEGRRDDIEVVCGCALGALAIGLGLDPIDVALQDNALFEFGPLGDAIRKCPGDVCTNKLLIKHLIPHLNDKHEWSAEQIATWLKKEDLA